MNLPTGVGNGAAVPPPTDEELQPVYDDIRRGMRWQLIRDCPELETPEVREEREAFRKSARRRKLGEGRVQEMLEARAKIVGWVDEWRNALTDEDIRRTSLLLDAAAIFKEARQRGYRTPHKA